MPINQKLQERNQGLCELCNANLATEEYTVTPRNDSSIDNQVPLCNSCLIALDQTDAVFHKPFLEESMWSQEPAVQALSYRILQKYKEEKWAVNLLNSVDFDEDIIQWAMSAFDIADVHKDAYGNVLENGDNVILTQALNVKGTNFTASKGTAVKRIKLVHDNTEQIEGKINDQTIVILTKFVKKS
jgi:protein PhnA